MKIIIITIIIIIVILCLIGGIIFYYKYFEKPSIPAPFVETYPASSVWKNGEILKVNDYKISPNGKIKLHIKSVIQGGGNTIFITINDKLNTLSGMTPINTSETNTAYYTLVDNGLKKNIVNDISHNNIDAIQVEYMLKNNKKYPVQFKLNNEYDYYDDNGNLLGTRKFDPWKKSDFQYIINDTRNFNFTDKINYIVVKDDGIYIFNTNNKLITFLR